MKVQLQEQQVVDILNCIYFTTERIEDADKIRQLDKIVTWLHPYSYASSPESNNDSDFLAHQIEQAESARDEWCEFALQASIERNEDEVRVASVEIENLTAVIERLSKAIEIVRKGGDAKEH